MHLNSLNLILTALNPPLKSSLKYFVDSLIQCLVHVFLFLKENLPFCWKHVEIVVRKVFGKEAS